MAGRNSVDLSGGLNEYLESCARLARERLPFSSIEELAAAEEALNAYPGLEALTAPEGLLRLEEEAGPARLAEAREAVLEGRIFWEHAGAGEATRLGLGPKYLIHPHEHLRAWPEARALLPLTLGARHLAQQVFEISRLAEEYGLDPARALGRQRTLLVVSEHNQAPVLAQILRQKQFGFKPENFLFMVQASFPGLRPDRAEGWAVAQASPRRLHNHGQMAMQKTMDGQLFHLDGAGGRHFLSRADFFARLRDCDDLVSYNIEDLDYLTGALDFAAIGLALAAGRQGCGMTMEVVGNHPEHPIKGGLCAFDPALGRNVMVESFRLHNLAPAQIKFLNKNFNHYPHPARTFAALNEEGLFMPVSVKDGYLYFQPVQGDINFLVKTAFVAREKPAPIQSWKSAADTAAALAAMAAQDRQPGFAGFVAARAPA